ncbi:hypothetical protein [Clostridium tyrobutyricum]|uniref:hypothetical protein n=1 Tax=Clostridium tyrobutyricum TaxID=1519 RepID=UPI00242F6E56|nr:hypothetical protein [Clostridium tyrobutyricum]
MIYITIGIIISIVLLRTLFNNFYYTYSNYLMSRFAEFNNYSSTTDVSVYKYAIDQIGYFIKHNNFLVVMLGDGAGTLLNINFTNNSLISMNGQNFFIDNLYTTLIFKFGIIGIVFAILIYFTLIKKSYRIYFYNKHNENINLLCFGILNYCILDFLTLFVGLGVFYSRFYTILLIIMVILDKTTISRNKS